MRKEKGAPTTSAPIVTDGKVNAFSGQLQTIRQIFLTPMSMLMASFATGIYRANICRYVRTMRQENTITVHHREKDPFTGFEVNFYTTDPRFIKKQPLQLMLNFKEWEE